MIDPSFDDPTLGTLMEVPTYAEMKAKVDDLEKQLEQKTTDHQFVVERNQTLTRQINSFEGALKNNEWDFDSDTLESLADFFDIELQREFDVTITVRWSGTVTAPMNFDIDDLENYLDIRIDTDYRTSDATVDLYQDDFEVDWTEA